MKKFNVKGFPTILLLKSDGTVTEFTQRVSEDNLNVFVANNANTNANNVVVGVESAVTNNNLVGNANANANNALVGNANANANNANANANNALVGNAMEGFQDGASNNLPTHIQHTRLSGSDAEIRSQCAAAETSNNNNLRQACQQWHTSRLRTANNSPGPEGPGGPGGLGGPGGPEGGRGCENGKC